MKRILGAFALAVAAACVAGAAQAQAPVADYYSTTSLLDGQALPAGPRIEVFDSDDVRCGYAEANAQGHFLIHVYGNDPMTPAVDEGAREGEMLTWRLDSIDILPANAAWIANLVGLFADLRFENGAAKEIRLEAITSGIELECWSDVKTLYRR